MLRRAARQATRKKRPQDVEVAIARGMTDRELEEKSRPRLHQKEEFRSWDDYRKQRARSPNPEHWQNRAEEARAIADGLNDPIAKRTMQEITEG
jgi:hypothetical protein